MLAIMFPSVVAIIVLIAIMQERNINAWTILQIMPRRMIVNTTMAVALFVGHCDYHRNCPCDHELAPDHTFVIGVPLGKIMVT